ncbi:MAG: phosphoribosylanthranilate isomerase [Phycisphaerales bacterium]|nr:phosphoribosylanthranilate isomerase [Phycisphaerales bacterium]
MHRTRIKICGVRDPDTALVAAECGADAVGFVFVKSSPRYIEPELAWETACYLPPFITKVGLFVNARPEAFHAVREACPFDTAQLHGTESEPTVRACGPGVIKALKFDPTTIEADLLKWAQIDDVDALLIDGSDGGLGQTFNWRRLAEVQEMAAQPLIIAGGLTPENVGEAIDLLRPWAVDVSSGVEVEGQPGVKDPDKIAAFCEAVRRADASMSE